MFDWLRRCPIDSGAKRWTEDRVGWLLGQFGRDRLQNAEMVVPARKFFPDRYDNSEDAAGALFDRTCSFMGIDRAAVELVFYQPTHRPGLARSLRRSQLSWVGQHELRDERSIVRLDVTLLPLPELVLAVFAHELCHQHLLGSKRIRAEDRDHELVTDLATVFFGMGVFNANHSFRDRYRIDRRGGELLSVGYLTPVIWAYALALCAWLRGEESPAWGDWIRVGLRKTFCRSLAYLVRTGDATVVDGGELDENARMGLLKVAYPGFARSEFVAAKEVDHHDPEAPHNAEIQSANDDCEVDSEGVDSVELLLEASQDIEAGKWDAAIERLNDVLRREPENGTAYQQRALVYLEMEKFDDALLDAEAAVRFEPDDLESYLARGAAHIKVGRFDEALVDLTRYVDEEDVHATDGRRPSRGYYLRGLAQAGLGNYQRAIQDYGRAICRFPDWPEPYEARAEAHEHLGNPERAHADRDEGRRRAMP
jgi:tetratricopeptide (TPR) repeat protein